jgi:ribosomal-protein-alanine N-acetyltransferase
MTEALAAALRHCFEELRLNRVYAGHLEGNGASGRVLQKCGLRYEGTQRQEVRKDGRFADNHMYAILREDYLSSHK